MRIGIIGAGAAGLAAASVLKSEHDLVVFEQQDQLGGLWNYRSDPELGTLYPTLRTNLPRELMAFWDFPFDDKFSEPTTGDFPGHRDVLNYLTAYAEYQGLISSIKFNTTIKSITPEPQSRGWTLITGSNQKASFDAIVVANGHYSQPRLPEIKGSQTFPGTITHSKNYREPSAFTSQRVMIWGTAASGQDLSREISGEAQQVFLSGNQGPSVKTSQRSNVSYHADPVKIDGHTVYLSDKTAISHIDSVIYCTGYNYVFPFLSDEIIDVTDNLVSPLYKDIIHPEHPTLAFIGIPYLIIPFPLFITQAAWFAAVLAGYHTLPARQAMKQEIAQKIASFQQKNIKPWHYHRLGDLQGPYMDSLINDYGGHPVPNRFHQLAKSAQLSRQKDPDGFRKLNVRQILAQVPE